MILWSIRGTLLRRFEGHRRDVTCLAFTRDGKTLASASEDGAVRLWDVAAGTERLKLAAADEGVQALVTTPDGKGLIAEGAGHVLQLWDTAGGRERRQFRGHTGRILALAITRGGETLASSSTDGTLRLWDVAAGTEKRLFRLEKTVVNALAFAPDKTLVTANANHILDTWRPQAVETPRQVAGHRAPVDGVAFSDDGREVRTRAGEEGLRWDRATGRLLGSLEAKPAVQTVVEARSPDGKIVLTPGARGAILARETATGEKLFELPGHDAPVTSLAFSPDGRAFVSGSADTSALVWDLLGCLPPILPRQRGPWMEDLDLLWGDLEEPRGEPAYQALRVLSAMPDKAIPYLKRKAPLLADARRIQQRVRDLDDDAFAVREAASVDLAKSGVAAEVALRQALRDNPSAELRRRALDLLQGIEEDEAAVLRGGGRSGCWR